MIGVWIMASRSPSLAVVGLSEIFVTNLHHMTSFLGCDVHANANIVAAVLDLNARCGLACKLCLK